MTDFDAKYVITNNAPGSPAYDERFITTLKEEIVRAAPELDPIIDPVMVSGGELFSSLTKTTSLMTI